MKNYSPQMRLASHLKDFLIRETRKASMPPPSLDLIVLPMHVLPYDPARTELDVPRYASPPYTTSSARKEAHLLYSAYVLSWLCSAVFSRPNRRIARKLSRPMARIALQVGADHSDR